MCSTREQHRLDMCFVSAESEWQRVWEAQHRNMYIYVWKWKNIVLILRKNILPSEPGWKIFFAKCKYLVKGEKKVPYIRRSFSSHTFIWMDVDAPSVKLCGRKAGKGWKIIHRITLEISWTRIIINISIYNSSTTQLFCAPFTSTWSYPLNSDDFPLSFLEYDGTKVYAEFFHHRRHLILFTANWISRGIVGGDLLSWLWLERSVWWRQS